MARKKGRKAKTPEGVRRKTDELIAEGDDPKQAAAIAWNMHRRGRLTKRGGHVGGRRGKRVTRGGKRVTLRRGYRR